MSETGGAFARATVRVLGDVENNVVRMRGIVGEKARGAGNGGQRALDPAKVGNRIVARVSRRQPAGRCAMTPERGAGRLRRTGRGKG